MVSVDDYSVYVTEIKLSLRKVEDYCLKAEVGATEDETVNAILLLTEIALDSYQLTRLVRKNLQEERNK
jgi:hypothetical protein